MAMTDGELAAKIVERMGAKWIEWNSKPMGSSGYWQFPNGNKYLGARWNPIDRADHWWRVVEWVRGQGCREQAIFSRQLEWNVGSPSVPLHWFLLNCERPGRAICEVFVEVFCD